MMRILLCLLAFMVVSVGTTRSQSDPEQVPFVVLDVDGQMMYIREGWKAQQQVFAGSSMFSDDLVFSEGASISVLCSNLQIVSFQPGELLKTDSIACPNSRYSFIRSASGQMEFSAKRGGAQYDEIPYVIYPRNTVLLKPNIIIRWHPIENVDSYQIHLIYGLDDWTSPQLLPDKVQKGDEAVYELPVALEPNSSYSINLCVIFTDLTTKCTSDPEWSGGTLPFVYVNDDMLVQRLNSIQQALGNDTAASLFAQSVLLSNYDVHLENSIRLSPYQDAISLINQLLEVHSDSHLFQSPAISNYLGTMYLKVMLPQNALHVYERSLTLAEEGTIEYAEALLGIANSELSIDTFDRAIKSYVYIVSDNEIGKMLEPICKSFGTECLKLHICSDVFQSRCEEWVKESS